MNIAVKWAIHSFITALQFLTCIRIAKPTEWSTVTCGQSVRFFPLVGAVLGLILVGAGYIMVSFLPIHVLAALLIGGEIFLTGGLHCDGFIDTADGIFSGRARVRMLEIMKDSHVGAYGVTMFGVWLLLKWSLLVDLPSAALLPALYAMPILGRLAMVTAILRFPYARPEGIGKAFADNPGQWTLPIAFVSVILLLVPLGAKAAALACLVCLTGYGVAWWLSGRLGGLTGDTYGAINEITEIAVLLYWLVI